MLSPLTLFSGSVPTRHGPGLDLLKNCTIGTLDLTGARLKDFDLRGTDSGPSTASGAWPAW